MRKKALFLIVLLMLNLSLAGCSASAQTVTSQVAEQSQTAPPTLGQHTNGAVEEAAPTSDDSAARSEAPAEPSAGSASSSEAAAPVMTGYLPRSDAIQIAIDHAQVERSQLFDLSCELDEEDGVVVYQVEFECGQLEYEYEVHAETGEILHVEVEDD